MDRMAVGVQVASAKRKSPSRAGGPATGLRAGLITIAAWVAAWAGCAHQEPALSAPARTPSASAARQVTASAVASEPLPPSRSSGTPQVDLEPPPSRSVELPPPVAVEAEPLRQRQSVNAPPPKTDSRTPIPLYVLAGAIEPIHGDDPTLPDQVLAVSRGKVLEGSYQLCIAQDGTVQSVTPVVGIEGVDRCVVDTLKTWQFPKLRLRTCKLQTMRFEIQ